MKALLHTIAVLLIVAAIPARAVTDTFLKAAITGTVQTQTIVGPNDGRIHTATLNAKRIFQEFGVSKTDYELVFVVGNSDVIALLPKHASSGLPTITVLGFMGGFSAEVVNTKTQIIQIDSGLSSPATGNLFENLVGELNGTLHYTGAIGTDFTKFTFSGIASGTDQGGPGSALLKFRFTTSGKFTQAP